jgi:hypothetical protein
MTLTAVKKECLMLDDKGRSGPHIELLLNSFTLITKVA